MIAALFDTRLSIVFCGASIINEKQVMTAAHCLKAKRRGEMTVIVGGHDISKGIYRIICTYLYIFMQMVGKQKKIATHSFSQPRLFLVNLSNSKAMSLTLRPFVTEFFYTI